MKNIIIVCLFISTFYFASSTYILEKSKNQEYNFGGFDSGKGTSDYIKKWYSNCSSGEVNSIYLPHHYFPNNEPDIQITCPGKIS